MCDVFAVPLAVGIGIGRLGCFHAGCCRGVPTSLPWGVDFGDGIACHPTQLYESAFHLSAAVVLWQFQRRGMFRGQLIRLYLVAYFIFRFATEFDSPRADDLAGAYRLSVGSASVDRLSLHCGVAPGYRPGWSWLRPLAPPLLPNDTGDGPLKPTRHALPETPAIAAGHDPPTRRPRLPASRVPRARRDRGVGKFLAKALLSSRRSSTRAAFAVRSSATALPILSGSGDGCESAVGESPAAAARSRDIGPCVALLEITAACNLRCPVCFAADFQRRPSPRG